MGSEEKETVDFGQLCRLIDKLPKGKARIDAYAEAIRLADKLQNTDRQLEFRFGYASAILPNASVLRQSLALSLRPHLLRYEKIKLGSMPIS